MSVLKYVWGKAKKIDLNNEIKYSYHPLICHLIDVAAVAEALWDNVLSKYLKNRLDRVLFDGKPFSKELILFLAGIHDIGKATPIFQSKVPELATMLLKFGLTTFSDDQYHSILSGQIFQNACNSGVLKLPFDDLEFIRGIKYVLAGHHGTFPKSTNFGELIAEHTGDESWKKVQQSFLDIIIEFSGLNHLSTTSRTNLKEPIDRKEFNAFLMFLAGFISVVDWIGSNECFFDYYVSFENLEELKENYFELSRSRAKEALKIIGWDGWKTTEDIEIMDFKEVFPFIKDLRPLQSEIVKKLNSIPSPSLIIIEAPMGEGKTEAALYLGYYFETIKQMQGSYIALPTQATANQMFQRVKKFLSQVKKGARVNLHLLHGNAIISDEYELLKTNSKNFEQESNIVADEWFSYRKRGLISPFGVGTVDQIMLSVLPLKHFFVRLFGLAGKVILIDEVHSYDIYMSTILEDLLRWLHYLGSSVILLSATLPSHKRKKLIETYLSESVEIEEKPYPRLIICSEDGIKTSTFATALQKKGEESVLIEWVEEKDIVEKIMSSMKDGGRTALICNKIRRAQNFYNNLKFLKDQGVKIDLLHSRFPFHRRKEIEDGLLTRFGKKNDHTKSAQLLISTQIIEQSLDLDFDLMISDLAPIDLLFQRMGRLHRHPNDEEGRPVSRPKMLTRPQFWVIKPRLNESKIPQLAFPIYSKHILLKTFLSLWPVKTISIPDDLEPMIETVYSDKLEIPKIFQEKKREWIRVINEAKIKRMGKDEKKILSARYKLIPNPSNEDFFEDFSAYFKENAPEAEIFLNSLTRITSPSITLVCLYKNKDMLSLDEAGNHTINLKQEPNFEEAKLILNYGIRVSHYPLFKYFTQHSSKPSSWKKNVLIRHFHQIILSKEENTNKYYFDIPKYRIYLNIKLGLFIEKQKTE